MAETVTIRAARFAGSNLDGGIPHLSGARRLCMIAKKLGAETVGGSLGIFQRYQFPITGVVPG